MAFSRAKLKRFNDVESCAPPVGSYDPKKLESAVTISLNSKEERFRECKNDQATPSIPLEGLRLLKLKSDMSSTHSIESLYSIKSESGAVKKSGAVMPSEFTKLKELERQLRSVLLEKSCLAKELEGKSVELQKVEGKMYNCSKLKLELEANLARGERRINNLLKINEVLKSKVEKLEKKGQVETKKINFDMEISVLKSEDQQISHNNHFRFSENEQIKEQNLELENECENNWKEKDFDEKLDNEAKYEEIIRNLENEKKTLIEKLNEITKLFEQEKEKTFQLTNEMKQLNEAISDLKMKEDQGRDEMEKIQLKLMETSNNCEGFKEALAEATQCIQNLNNKTKTLNLENDELKVNLKSKTDEFVNLENLYQEKIDTLDDLENYFKAEKISLAAETEKMKDSLQNKNIHIDNLEKSLDEVRLEYEKKSFAVVEAENKLTHCLSEKEEIREKMNKMEEEVILLSGEKDILAENYNTVKNEIDNYVNMYQVKMVEVEELRKNAEEKEYEKNEIRMDLEDKKVKLKELNKEKDELKESIEKLEKEKVNNINKTIELEKEVVEFQRELLEKNDELIKNKQSQKLIMDEYEDKNFKLSQEIQLINTRFLNTSEVIEELKKNEEKLKNENKILEKELENKIKLNETILFNKNEQCIEIEWKMQEKIKENEELKIKLNKQIEETQNLKNYFKEETEKLINQYENNLMNLKKVKDEEIEKEMNLLKIKASDLDKMAEKVIFLERLISEKDLHLHQANQKIEIDKKEHEDLTKKENINKLELEILKQEIKEISKDYENFKKIQEKKELDLNEKKKLIEELKEGNKKNFEEIKKIESEKQILLLELEEKNNNMKSCEDFLREKEQQVKGVECKFEEKICSLTVNNQSLIKETSWLKLQVDQLQNQIQDHQRQSNLQIQKQAEEFEIKISNYICLETQTHVWKEECSKWRRLYEDLNLKIEPFKDQIDEYEAERQALVSRSSNAQREIDKLSREYAKVLGHQNHKQKIKYMVKLKEENLTLKNEVENLRMKENLNRKRIEKLTEKLDAFQGSKRKFDPSLAFQNHKVEEEEEEGDTQKITTEFDVAIYTKETGEPLIFSHSVSLNPLNNKNNPTTNTINNIKNGNSCLIIPSGSVSSHKIFSKENREKIVNFKSNPSTDHKDKKILGQKALGRQTLREGNR